MFGNNKPFGTTSAFGTNTFGTTSTPFGQPGGTAAFGAKPATGNVFGASTFGTSTPATGSLFGNTAPTTTGLFGQSSTVFGQPASTSGGSFAFGGTSTSGGLFGTTTPATQSTGLFGGSNTSAFGAPRTGFGGFGTGTTTGTGLFGQTGTTGTGLFGTSTGFGTTQTPTNGTTVKFNPPTGTDTMMKGGVTQNINTRHQCITCMKEYENKSLEELRLEDYAANRKGPQTGIGTFGAPAQQATGGLFSNPAASTSAFSFGTTQSKPLFGTTTGTNTFGATGTGLFGQTQPTQNTGIFGKPVGFGTATTSAAPSFSFGNTAGTSLFGQNNQPKSLFGPQTGTGLFGQTATTQPSTGFGTGTTFGGFGATSQPSTGLFGAKPTGFGTSGTATTNTFSFGNQSATTGLFGQKPAAPGFGTGTGFGTGNAFGTFGQTQTTNTGLFGQNKPAGTGFGTTNTGFGSTLGTGFGTSTFSNMGMNTSTGGGLFGSTLTNKQPGFNFGGTAGTTGFGGGFGTTSGLGSNFNFGTNPTNMVGNDPNASNLQQQLQAQQVFAFTANPFGDNPLFRNNIKDSKRREELLKPTNPAAQKAVLTNSRYKVSPAPATKIKPKPVTPISCGKVSLFDGLEDEEPSLNNTSFIPKRNIKKLVMKSQSNSQSFTVTSNLTSTISRPTEISLSTSIQLQKSSTRDVNSVGDSLKSSEPLTVEVNGQSPLTQPIEVPISRDSPERHSSCDSPFVRKSLPDVPTKPIPEPDLNDTIEALHTKASNTTPKTIVSSLDHLKMKNQDSYLTSPSSLSETDFEDSSPVISDIHATGIKLTKSGYYTVPSLDEILKMKDENGNFIVADFVIGRKGYGKLQFLEKINLANLNLDDIVSFHHKEIVVYPDDDNKPPVGEGLNHKAEITLESIWPMDKTTHTPIKDPVRLSLMGYPDKLRAATTRLGAKFIEYIPESGSWIFQVDHFSKYGLEDSDEECEDPLQTKPKSVEPLKKVSVAEKTMSQTTQMSKKLRPSTLDDDDEMPDADIVPPNSVFSPLQQLVTAGVDSERIQGMKASFFVDDAEDAWESDIEMQEPIPRFASLATNRNFVKPVPIKKPAIKLMESESFKKKYSHSSQYAPTLRVSTVWSDHSVASPMTLSMSAGQEKIWSSFPAQCYSSHAKLQLPAVPDKSIAVKMWKVSLQPYKDSIAYGKEKCIADIGYSMGQRFRVGWGPGYTLVHLQQLDGYNGNAKYSVFDTMQRRHMSSNWMPSVVCVSKVEQLDEITVDETTKKNLVECLQIHLDMSSSEVEDEAPIFVPNRGVGILHSHANLSERHIRNTGPSHGDMPFIQQCNDVWELCVALWGDIPGLELERNQSVYAQHMARREAFSDWLIKRTREEILREINNNRDYDTSSYLSAIFSYLSGRQVAKAVSLAQEFGDHSLATLIAQAESNALIRQLILKQLENWEQSGAYNHINVRRLKLYVLLAGEMVWKAINCCEGIHWRRSLSLHLWFRCLPTSSIKDAVTEYENSFSNCKSSDLSEVYSQPPLPPYMQSERSAKPDESEMPVNIYDTCFHLLKLYCDNSHRLDKLVVPENYTASHNDYRLSWLLHQALYAIGYQHLPYDTVCCLHLKFAAQLEALDLWHWAVFVLLHLPDSHMRQKYVKDLLLRHLSLDHSDNNEEPELNEQEMFLLRKLHLPSEWIFQAKAIKAHSYGRPADEALYLLKAGLWSQSHSIVISQLASEAVINENYEYLLRFLRELSPRERSDTILDWPSGGQVYLDYIHISQIVESVIKGEISAYDIEKLQPEVVSLCHRLSSINCSSAKDRLCQSEMAKKTATLLRTVFTLQASRSGTALTTYALAPHIKSLPMPEDYALQEMRAMAHNYLITTSAE